MEEHRGGLTFVFTDIEGSTQLVRDLASSYGLALRIHRRILQTAFEEQGGKQMGTEGDALFFVFTSPVRAVTAAVAAQGKVDHYAWPEELRLRVRMGIHHGPVRMSGGEYVGLTVHEVSRICAAAHGGQILCSAAVARAVGDSQPGVVWRDLGTYGLRGIADAHTLYQVCAEGLEADFPPLREAIRDGGTRITIWLRGVPRRPGAVPPTLAVCGLDGQPLAEDGDVRVEVRPASGGAPGAFRVLVLRDGIVEEEYDGLTSGGACDAGAVVNAHSRLIRIPLGGPG